MSKKHESHIVIVLQIELGDSHESIHRLEW